MAIHKFTELRNKISPERRARITQKAQKTLAEIRLAEQLESNRQTTEIPEKTAGEMVREQVAAAI
ncbi:MAG: hypothetical protein LBG72_03290 [Spirochaetaceae bacterium]|nr:hypothetical protein [Spirochaetaceae bacterium]